MSRDKITLPGMELRELRRILDETQEQFAGRFGISRRTQIRREQASSVCFLQGYAFSPFVPRGTVVAGDRQGNPHGLNANHRALMISMDLAKHLKPIRFGRWFERAFQGCLPL